MLNQKLVSSLYVAVYNRSPELSGLNYWTEQLNGNQISFAQLSNNFVKHPVFEQTYGGLSNQAKVATFYKNVLGHEGDAEGIAYWTDLLNKGHSVGEVLSEFLHSSLTVDLNSLNLSSDDYSLAQVRQNTLKNKVDVSIFYAEELGSASELSPNIDTNSLAVQNDPKYQQAQLYISQVNDQAYSVTQAKNDIIVIRPEYDYSNPNEGGEILAFDQVLSAVDFTPLILGDYATMGISANEWWQADQVAESLFHRIEQDSRFDFYNDDWANHTVSMNDYIGDINYLLNMPAMVKGQNYILDQVGLSDYRLTGFTQLSIDKGWLNYGITTANMGEGNTSLDLVGILNELGGLEA